jgi:8-oxo-dGTP pyrophosphatase MutT (NUDIX family)
MSHALYQVTVKLQLMHGDKLLTLTTPDNFIDFPGGRIDDTEQGLAMEDVLAREIREELGEGLRYRIVDTAFVAYRSYDWDGETKHVLAVHYRAEYIRGDIELSDEHKQFAWVEPAALYGKGERFCSSDEYNHFHTYYSALA